MATTTTSKPSKPEQSLFEEDDEFEEFPTEGTARRIFWGWGGVHTTPGTMFMVVGWKEVFQDVASITSSY